MTTSTTKTLVPERLNQALAARGFSATELAARLNVTTTTLSRWRNKVQVPSASAMELLAKELRVTAEWLTRPMRVAISKPNFRGSIAQLKQDRSLLQSRAEWLEEVAAHFEEHVEYPDVELPCLQVHSLSEITTEMIEAAADACRKEWRMGDAPAGDILLLLENSGVIVAREETGVARIEGLSMWSDAGRPYVLLCADKGNAYRSRFDAAHELGHLILHRYIESPSDPRAYKLMETQAHLFAGAFLLPARGFLAEIGLPVSLHGLLQLKQRWGVSVGAMIMRLRALGVIDEDGYLRLIKYRSAKWGQKREPNDDDREPEQPRLLRRTFELLVNEGVIDAEALPAYMGLSAHDLESLLSLPMGYLSRKKADIVELAIKRRDPSDSAVPAIGDSKANVVTLERFRK